MTKTKRMTMTRNMTLATITDAERDTLATCIHEAGHAVAAVILGGTVERARILDGRTFGLRGETHSRNVLREHEPAVTYAGPYAEARWRAGRTPHLTEVRAVFGHLGHGDHAALLASGGPLPRGIEQHVENTWPAVVSIAKVLHRESEIRHADVCAALQIPEADNGHHLAVIRSGSWPVNVTRPNN